MQTALIANTAASAVNIAKTAKLAGSSHAKTGTSAIMTWEDDDDLVIGLDALSGIAPGDIMDAEVVVNSEPSVASLYIDDSDLIISFLSPGQTNVVLMLNTVHGTLEAGFVIGVVPRIEGDYIISDLSMLDLAPESHWNGADMSGGFVSGMLFFPNDYNPDWGAWNGWAYSNISDNETPGWLNQYSAITGSAMLSEEVTNVNYAVSYAAGQGSMLHFDDPSAHELKGMYVTNTTYAALSMIYGDDYAKKFGGPDGDDPDWFKLSVTGFRDGLPAETVEYYLADYRFSDNSKNYVIQTWQWLELSQLGKTDSLQFSLSSSDVGDWGMNTPAYFAADMLYVVPDLPPYVAHPIEAVYTIENAPDHVLDISQVFSDPDDDDADILISLKENTNEPLVSAVLEGSQLRLALTPDQWGVARITLEAWSNGKTATEEFHVYVANQSEELFIHEVLAYKPAPGQFINKAPWGLPSSAASIIGGLNGSLSLGAYGGYVVFRFSEAVINHPDNPYGIDFIIFGNALSHWSEPGVVWVMKDENGSGKPDGTWFQLAGSDHFFSSAWHDYEVTYFNPGGDTAQDVPWQDNRGNQGVVSAHAGHNQSYYPDHELFPDIAPDQYTLTGTRLADAVDMSVAGMVQSPPRAFGYADNRPRGAAPFYRPDNPYTPETEHAGGDGFDISWAIDEEGNYVDLDMIHFIKVQSAVLANAGWMGEVSTEITGAIVVRADKDISGPLDMIVIKDLPCEITTPQYQLEAFAFHRGRKQPDAALEWSTDLEGTYIDDLMVMHLQQSGELTITARLAHNQEVMAVATTYVNLDDDPTLVHDVFSAAPIIYPNPARHHFRIKNTNHAGVTVYSLSGKMMMQLHDYAPGSAVDVSKLPAGLYIVEVKSDNQIHRVRLLKTR